MKNSSALEYQLQFAVFLLFTFLSGCASERPRIMEAQATAESGKAKSLQVNDMEKGSFIKRELNQNSDQEDFVASEESVSSQDVMDSNESSLDLPVLGKPESLGIRSSNGQLPVPLIEAESGEANESGVSVKIESHDNLISTETMELISDKLDSPSDQKPWIERETPINSGSVDGNANDSKIEDLNHDFSKVGKTAQSNPGFNATETISGNNPAPNQKFENSDNSVLEPLENNNKLNVSQNSVQEDVPRTTVILNAANENLKSSISTEKLKKQIGLKDVFKEETDLLPKENLSFVLSESSDQSEYNKSPQNLVLGKNQQTTSNRKSGNGLNVVLGNPLEEISRENSVGVQSVIPGNSKREGESSGEGIQNLDVGFNVETSATINENGDSELQQIGFGNNKPNNSSDSRSVSLQTQLPNNRKRKDYLKVRDFLIGRTEISKTNDQNESIRNYQNLKNWVLSEAEDLNQSKPLKQSSPKQFKRASEWIRQKGRLREVE